MGYEKQTIYNMIHNKKIPFHRLSLKAVRFKKEEIDAWIKSRKEGLCQYLKKDNKYYVALESSSSLFQTEHTFLEDVKGGPWGYWNHWQLPFKFDKEDLKTAKEMLKQGLIYPRAIENDTFVYDAISSDALDSYLIILKVFKDKLKLDINSLQRLKVRLIENVKENFPMPDPDTEDGSDKNYIGFSTETLAYKLLMEFTKVVVYLEYEKKDFCEKYSPYKNRYFDKESFLSLYLRGFCYFNQQPFIEDPDDFILKDKTIDEATPEQIAEGLKEKVFTTEEVSKRVERLEAEVKALKSVIKQNAKGGNKHGSRNEQ